MGLHFPKAVKGTCDRCQTATVEFTLIDSDSWPGALLDPDFISDQEWSYYDERLLCPACDKLENGGDDE